MSDATQASDTGEARNPTTIPLAVLPTVVVDDHFPVAAPMVSTGTLRKRNSVCMGLLASCPALRYRLATMRAIISRTMGLCLIAVGFVACGESEQTPQNTSDSGVIGDAIPDSFTDSADPETASPPVDTGAEAAQDVSSDVPIEAAMDVVQDVPSEASVGPCGRPWNHDVDAPYAIEATWMFGRKDACAWQDVLEKFHRAGGQWVWQFGPELKPRTRQDLESDPAFSDCKIGAVSCIQHAIDSVGESRIEGFLSYSFGQAYSSAIAACPNLDQQVTIGSTTWHRIVLPTTSSQGSCPSSGKVWVMFAVSDGMDSEQLLLDGADALGMKVILGMPGIAHSKTKPWDVEPTLLAAGKEWSRRVFLDYQARAALHPSFAGTYQTFEVPLIATGLDAAYGMYGQLAELFHGLFPTKLFALSPYWAANKLHGNSTAADVSAGVKRLAMLGIDIIAPQDGRGTSKGALYWPYEKDKPIEQVDPELAKASSVPAGATFAQTYNASTFELFLAARKGIDEANAAGAHATLWANFEAFEPTTTEPCSYVTELGRTSLKRLDRAITMGAGPVQHVISYMYDPLFTCTTTTQPKALIDEILEQAWRPLVDTAFKFSSGGKEGIIVRGYHVADRNPRFSLTWYDSAWTVQTTTVVPSWTNPTWGLDHEARPFAQEAFIPFEFKGLAPAFWIHIRAENDAGSASESFSFAY
ncbi:MAG TPA: hypothetical protein PLM08_03945 [Polyangiaceae bacterium]|nr:hypothetical protein [Polyangiaceae bacterium]